MEIAPEPQNEKQRIEALKSYNILDTLPEKEYDDITQLASFICDTPIALISLVDQNRQWFKSKTGLNESETNRDLAFCAHTILNPSEPLIVENTDNDKRFANNPLVTGAPNVKFYVGCPLNTSTGESLGTLCVIDSVSRKIIAKQEHTLKVLADNVVNLLELRKAKAEQKQLINKLYSSNNELEQFAYIASHDLQEPLRVVSSYVQLISKRYKGNLDTDIDKFIVHTVDGCNRMEKLIEGLLEFSQVGTNQTKHDYYCANKILAEVISTLNASINESNAKITCNELPSICANKMQISLVFQNLILNAIKYNESDSPKIKIHAEKDEKLYVFKVKNNGIGIDEKFHNSIFEIFKRLHSRNKYKGTGIGLSICKKIIEQHNGEIFIESSLGMGTTIIFTLPAEELNKNIHSNNQATYN